MGGSGCTGFVNYTAQVAASCLSPSQLSGRCACLLFFQACHKLPHIAMLLYNVRQHIGRNKYKHAVQTIWKPAQPHTV